ncbi:MAG: circularly permuted type 2 ATP-grasp protein, partial [Usitatibacter sp.]
MAPTPTFNEMFTADRAVRPHYAAFAEWLAETPPARIAQNRQAADLLFHRVGITFAVYGEASGTERLIPFDIVPHVIPGAEWDKIARGLRQRVGALNRFLHDIYHRQEIILAGKIPADQIEKNSQFRPEMIGVDVPGGVYSHIAGVDIVRAGNADGSGSYYVLEDNLRVPSGVSYMLEN